MDRLIRSVALLIFVALLLISEPPTTRADVGQDERTAVSGSVWVLDLPEQLTIFEVKPDGTVRAGRWGYAGMKEDLPNWTGTFRNGRLELKD